MLKLINKSLGVVFFVFFILCTTQQAVFTQTNVVKVPEILQEDKWIKNNLELEKIVQIETTKEHVIGSIRRIILYKDKFIILDSQQPSIFIVDAHTGKVEKEINSKGRGPGESNSILDIAFDEKREHILVYNDYEKLLYFNLDGKLLREERIIGKLFENITCENDNIIFYNDREGLSCFPHSVDIYNLNTQKWKTLGKKQKVDFHIRGRGRIMVKSKNIWFAPVLDYGLHLLIGDTIMIPYKLAVKKPITADLIKKSSINSPSFHNEVKDRNILFGIQSIRETEKYLIFTTSLPGLMMMYKFTLELHGTTYIEDEYLGIKLLNYFPHEGDDNRVMFIVQPHEWMERKPYNQNNMPAHLKVQIKQIRVNEESNPILVFYKEK